MLPEDSKARKEASLEKLRQSQVEDHFNTVNPATREKPEPYSDELFKEAAIQWLIETDQVCSPPELQCLNISIQPHVILSPYRPSNTQPINE